MFFMAKWFDRSLCFMYPFERKGALFSPLEPVVRPFVIWLIWLEKDANRGFSAGRQDAIIPTCISTL
jgi:hypothetical protein